MISPAGKRVVGLASLLSVGVAAGLSMPVRAQQIVITVTGSNIIPRIEGESALPVQVITREDIERANIKTAAELVNTLPANTSPGGGFETESITAGPVQPGFAGASLRGLGQQRTLILLNGRRIANYALTTSGSDLNSIPVAAIDRVEVLKEGASAVYGSDAIAGVINFILRKDFQGAEAYAQYTSPQHTGGYGKHYNVTVGYGDLAAQKFNVFATLDYQEYGGIRAKDRQFSARDYIPEEDIDNTSSNSFPANVDTSPDRVRNPTGDPGNSYRNPTCAPPLSFPTNDSPNQCRFSPAQLLDIFDPSERLDLVSALTWQFDPNHQFVLQGTYTRNKFTFAVQPTGIAGITLPPTSAYYPHAFAQFFGIDDLPLSIRWRALELGRRIDLTTSEQWGVVASLQGLLNGWDYNGALNYNESNVTDRYVDGYLRTSLILPILNSGVVNPFGFNTPEVVALMSSAKLNLTAHTAKGTTSSFDFHASREIHRMPAGPLMLAVGVDARQEKLSQIADPVLLAGDIVGFGETKSIMGSRNVGALYSEANIPIIKTVEGNVAVRYDHYSDFGSTTNPKVSVRWQPAKAFLMRGSAGTGFHAPSLPVLFSPQVVTQDVAVSPIRSDPIRCPVTQSAQDCQVSFPVVTGGNPLLQPEKAQQWSVGAVWAPTRGLSLGVDYFATLLKNRIAAPSMIFGQCPDGVNGPTCSFIHRGPVDPNFPNLAGPIVAVDTFLVNSGKSKATGLDVSAEYEFPRIDWGRFKLTFNGTYNIKLVEQQGDGSYLEFVDQAIPRWRHYVVLDWDHGPWSATLTGNFQLGSKDAFPGPNTGDQLRVTGNYEVWNLSGSYTGFRNVTLSAGIKNVLDRAPPFSNQRGSFQIGYDPSYTDPHGRLFWAGIKYASR